ncbi:MAG: NAD synthetase [Latescibacteria bacterium DG_63]|nr:MAG: NAD synthetase [Latescibacteria bacterium DG_63]
MGNGGPKVLRVALAQVNLSVGDLEGNRQKIIEYINHSRGAQADLVAFPELSITGYPPEDLLLKSAFIRGTREALSAIVDETEGIVAIVGLPHFEGSLYNAAAICRDGKLISVYKKILLPNYGVFDEKRYFTPGDEPFVCDMGALRFAVNICEDIWQPDVSRLQGIQGGAHVIVNISSSPYFARKGTLRQDMLSARARDNSAAVCYVNLVGGQDELVFDGESLVFSSDGTLLARAPQFDETLLLADIDIERIIAQRKRGAKPPLKRTAMGGVPLVDVGEWTEVPSRGTLKPSKAARLGSAEEVYRALVLGTHDYVRKNGFEKVVVGLSGGIDSSLVTVIAVDALGAENVKGVFMPSRFTSHQSQEDAVQLARGLGIEILTIPIEGILGIYLKALESAFQGKKPDVTEENIQARIRGNILMALSNKFGWLVLATGNKSEIAVGYSTLYGDTAGGFAVIRDVPKMLVYELARFRNSSPGGAVIPRSVLTKAPSAELKPDQRDSDSLPEYETLDPILEAYIEEDKSREEIIDEGFKPHVVDRVISMVHGSEYKRRQAPPGVKITPKAFGKDRRMPITNLYRPEK